MATYTIHIIDADGCDMTGYDDRESRANAIGRVVELLEDDEYLQAGAVRGEVRIGSDVVWQKTI